MDAVELPLPANVTVKLLSPDGFGRVGKSDNGPDSSVFGGRKASDYGSYHKEVKCPVANSEYNSVSRKKVADEELFMHNKLPSVKCEENGNKRHHLGEADMFNSLLLKNESQPLNKKSAKNLSILPCPKRPRTDLPEHSLKTCGSDASHEITRNVGVDIISCNSAERSRTIKQKRCQDSKKTEKRSFRAGGKLKYETGLAGSDSTCVVNNILGSYGLKSELHDVAELIDEVSLSELLDGSHRYSKLYPDKGKKTGNANENTLALVRRACDILTSHSAIDGNVAKKSSTGILNLNDCSVKISDVDGIHKCIEESLSSKVEDHGQGNMKNSTLNRPKKVLNRLALPPANDLDVLVRDSNVPSLFPESTTTLRSGNLPTFPWSFTHNGTCKSSSDISKSSSARITCQSRWVRMWKYSASVGDECSSSSDLDIRKSYNKCNSLNQQKIDDLLQYMKSLSLPDKAFEQSVIISNDLLEAKPVYFTTPMEASGVYDSRAQFGKQTNFHDCLQHNMSSCKDQHACSTNRCSDGSHCKSTNGGCGQSPSLSPMLDSLKSGHSQRVLAAAETLCEIASSSNAIKTRNQNDGNLRWLKVAPQKTIMKSRKSVFSVGKTDDPILTARPHDPIKTTCISSTKQKPIAEKNATHMNNIGRSPVRSSLSLEGTSLCKLEREPSTHHLKPLLGSNMLKPSSSPIHSVPRFERDFDSLQKSRHFGGTSIKDWSRGRSKKL
ncbi:hypothetical protein DsansV1_C20g0162761 [Dioscorea sansibarensis]